MIGPVAPVRAAAGPPAVALQADGDRVAFLRKLLGVGEDVDDAARRAAELGAVAVGPHATELIAEAATAIRSELTVRELGRTIHAHPTFSEAWMEAAHAVHGECIHAPPQR